MFTDKPLPWMSPPPRRGLIQFGEGDKCVGVTGCCASGHCLPGPRPSGWFSALPWEWLLLGSVQGEASPGHSTFHRRCLRGAARGRGLVPGSWAGALPHPTPALAWPHPLLYQCLPSAPIKAILWLVRIRSAEKASFVLKFTEII